MYSLVIDTSTKFLYLAIVNNEKIISQKVFEGSKNHAGNSVYQLQLMLNENNISVQDITSVYCGKGPGSYTGLRISVTIAKMLASFKDIKLYSISSLFLAGSGYNNKNVAVLFDARRGNSFCGCYGEQIIEDKLRDTKEFLSMVENLSDIKIVYEDDFKVDPIKVIKNSNEELSIEDFVPNYLRITEAEYNLEHNHD